MYIYFKRHDKVNFNWQKKYNSHQFNAACEQYDQESLRCNDSVSEFYDVEQVYVSSLSRTAKTYAKLNMQTPYLICNELNEVPIKAFVNTSFRLPTIVWFVVGRLQWLLQSSIQPETKRQTVVRVDRFIEHCLLGNSNVLIVGHGFCFTVFKKRLKRKGYKIKGAKIRLQNGETVQFFKS